MTLSMLALAAQGADAAAESAISGSTLVVVLAIWIFFLAAFLGLEIISKVPPTLHTPLMSGANAISGITIVGALYCASASYPAMAKFFGLLAIIMAVVNVVGGFLVTDRMLRFFGKKPSRG